MTISLKAEIISNSASDLLLQEAKFCAFLLKLVGTNELCEISCTQRLKVF